MFIAGIETHAASLKILIVDNRGYELSVDVKVELSIANSHFELVRRRATTNPAEGSPLDHRGIFAAPLIDDFVFRIVAAVDQKRVIFQLIVFHLAVHYQTIAGAGRNAIDAAGADSDGG